MLNKVKSRYVGKTVYIVFIAIILLIGDVSLANPEQRNWRWRNDDGDVYSASWKDSLNTPVVITDYENIRLRIENRFMDPYSSNISLRYTEDVFNGPWIKITGVDTGKFFISPSIYLSDTTSYFDNRLLLPLDTFDTYRKTITFDYTDNYLIVDPSSLYELEYSLKPTLKIQSGSAYFFSLFRDTAAMDAFQERPVLMTPPISWTISSISEQYPGYNLSDVDLSDANTGTIVGGNWSTVGGGLILKTLDGGITWNQQTCPSPVSFLRAVYFTNADIGTIVGTEGTILRTTDGGANWKKQNSGTNYDLTDVGFTNLNNGTVVGFYCGSTSCSSIILTTTNGGMTWTKQSYPNKVISSVCFINTNIGTVVGNTGTILRTTNGGQNWVTQSSGITGSLTDASFTDADNGIIVGNDWDSLG